MTQAQQADVQGYCDERFGAVRDAFKANFDTGKDVGASFAATVDGKLVIDLWGGYADAAKTRPWERDTIACVYSTTKTMAALCALILADRGELDFHAPVAKYWPEFAANGKAGIEVRHVMAHTSALPGWTEPMAPEDLYDWEKATSLLAAQAPWWEPGTASGYHSATQGYLIGEIVRRITGRSLGTFFREEVAEPLGADFHIGLPPECDSRVAEMIPPVELPPEFFGDPDSYSVRAFNNPLIEANASATTAWRRAEIPAANGHGNARSVATIQAIVANGGELQGKRFLSKQGCDVIFDEQINDIDLILGIPVRRGMGYGLVAPEAPVGPNPHTCYWGGWGGSIIVVDCDAHTTVSYVMNRMNSTTTGDERAAVPLFAFYAAMAGA